MSTKLHVAVDALGNPPRIMLTPGQRHEAAQAPARVAGFAAERVIADTAFAADAFRARPAEQRVGTVIPADKSRSQLIPHDKHLYRERHPVEGFISKIKHLRRIVTRYEKTARNFLARISLACAMIWLR